MLITFSIISLLAATLSLVYATRAYRRLAHIEEGLKFTNRVYAASFDATAGSNPLYRRGGYEEITRLAEEWSNSTNPHVRCRAAAALLDNKAELAAMVAYETDGVDEEETIHYYENVRRLVEMPARWPPAYSRLVNSTRDGRHPEARA
jgi:hypothetical protein